MGILSNILAKIFPSHTGAANAGTTTTAQGPSTPPSAGTAPTTSTSGTTAAATPAVKPMAEVDVEQMLNGMAQNAGEKLNWRTSIVDLMKLLGLDSSLAARKELAQELHYSGDMNDSAAMNIWLHRQVMNKVAANGGKVPADLKD
ncbi:DUF3597 domain-containing protein [Rhizobacter sp. Root404]|uniref:DUF3597 domain-containing protein n=1 Tax=Rhizobacter sp. Root404 TaxID=1736528 RepID=UPI0006F29615|nr:DUF3597 domain-containing protein [Rhizobacter sp. Root404]KQW37610.1 hypothetical protein ASC76_05730 [Rhizobacter sp. Root404]